MNLAKRVSAIVLGAFLFGALLPSFASAETSASDLIAGMNAERTSRGLTALRVDSRLTQAAQARAAVLANLGYIVHVSAPAGTPWPELASVGYTYVHAGENLALGFDSASATNAGWMASPGHRANILNSTYKDIGVGVTYGTYEGAPAPYIVVYFGEQATKPTTHNTQPTTAPVPTPVVNTVAPPTQTQIIETQPAVTQTQVRAKTSVNHSSKPTKPTPVTQREPVVRSTASLALTEPQGELTSATVSSEVITQEVKKERAISKLMSLINSIFAILVAKAGS